MNDLCICLAVTRTSDLAPEYHGPVVAAGIPWLAIGTIVLVIGVTIAAYWFVRRLRVPAFAIVDDLTLELCRGQGIGLAYRAVLDHVARAAGVQYTAELFLSASLYDRAVSAANLKKRLRGHQQDLLHELRRLLFEDVR